MENYFLNSIQCCKCLKKTLVGRSHTSRCTNCGTLLKLQPRPARMQSEKKIIMKPSKSIRPRKSLLKEEEKKKPIKKTGTKKKTLKVARESLKPKTTHQTSKDKKIIKKKKTKKHQNSPEDPVFVDYFSDRQANHNYYSDSFEEYSIDSPLLGFNSVFTTQSQIPHQLNLRSLNRVSQNLLNLFFDGLTEIEYVPNLSRLNRNSEIWSISHLLHNLVSMHPDYSNPTAPEVIKRIPIIRVSAQAKNNCSTCTICQEELKLSELVKKLSCSHLYHENCIDPWLSVRNTCPVCREVIC